MTAAQEVPTPSPVSPGSASSVPASPAPASSAPASPGPVLREDRLDYTPYAHNVAFCRRRAARLVAEWGHPALAGDAALLVSELATNALLHGTLPDRLFRVRLVLTAAALRIEVSDACGERLPGVRGDADAETGRGLVIVSRIADDWGIEPRTVGKTVFAELALAARSVPAKGVETPVGPRVGTRGPTGGE
ncbi:ATP-binding protein [Streptomyces sp. PTD5-9]|uniref:ATP-binding protein n=1 Tax=Streptomyces sp. PTD5-9 TaxID=3120150 RepID=UPI00300A3074